jgi:hypothetical protein
MKKNSQLRVRNFLKSNSYLEMNIFQFFPLLFSLSPPLQPTPPLMLLFCFRHRDHLPLLHSSLPFLRSFPPISPFILLFANSLLFSAPARLSKKGYVRVVQRSTVQHAPQSYNTTTKERKTQNGEKTRIKTEILHHPYFDDYLQISVYLPSKNRKNQKCYSSWRNKNDKILSYFLSSFSATKYLRRLFSQFKGLPVFIRGGRIFVLRPARNTPYR